MLLFYISVSIMQKHNAHYITDLKFVSPRILNDDVTTTDPRAKVIVLKGN